MVTMDADAITAMFRALVQEMGINKGDGDHRTLDEKNFKRIETFEGGMDKWQKFSSQVKIVVNFKCKL